MREGGRPRCERKGNEVRRACAYCGQSRRMWETERAVLQVGQHGFGDLDIKNECVSRVWPRRRRARAVSHRLILWRGSD